MSAPQIKACIFDMDGLLLDTETIYSQVTNKILEPYNKTFPIETKLKMMGRDVRTATEILLADLDLPLTFDEYDNQATELKQIYFGMAMMMPGAERLIRHLNVHSIPIALATSSSKQMFEIKTAAHKDIFGLFGSITCGDDPEVENSKPAPDIFLTAMRRLDNGLEPEDCLVFEDAENGVEAARSARMSSVWVQDLRFAGDGPVESMATEHITSLLEFDPVKYGLPAYD
ncbi:Pseudouridine-5'-phosphatase [Coemansia sp. RSA 2167]|nr:Pseudouridine-5'-phosphatase [Coemansia sp. RSA 2167]KAJ2190131.1 Pseudouridine-5'-phosphatase [Coemansia sp. RSA 522]KAJ2274635.1 Pseudouridine-5'-phosphatase [Coemansia sp. RSA 451]KAJ2840050.1 Pseudouridine-5'-phosphatase [Coemansia erecta]